MCSHSQPVRLVHQQVYSLPSLQHPLNILRHDPSHVLNLRLNVAYRIVLACLRRAVVYHQALQLAVECCSAIRGETRKVCLLRIISGEELFLDFNKVAERNAPTERGRGNDKIGKTAGGGVSRRMVRGSIGNVVDEVVVVCIG